MQKEFFIGLMSGTSMDDIDAVLIDCSKNQTALIASHSLQYSTQLKNRLETIIKNPHVVDLDELGEIDVLVAKAFSDTVNELLKHENLLASDITAIGSHGQTIRHRVDHSVPFTQQIGDPSLIAALTDITTVADFRRKDVALNGQGAPLVPAFHNAVFANSLRDRIVINIGGISNITILQKDGTVNGYDCGPGNTLMDLWAQQHIGMPFDHSGAWAAMGEVELNLLIQFLTDDYFKKAPPKSTGRENFNLAWLNSYLETFEEVDPMDVQATLCELSAQCIARDINKEIQDRHLDLEKVFICGGGAYNKTLIERITHLIPSDVGLTDELGLAVDWVEATAFAWMAKQTLNQKTTNEPNVTGAQRKAILGGIYHP